MFITVATDYHTTVNSITDWEKSVKFTTQHTRRQADRHCRLTPTLSADTVGRHFWRSTLTADNVDNIVGRQSRPSKMTFDTAQQCRPSTLTQIYILKSVGQHVTSVNFLTRGLA